ncbi:hypothetical protein BDW22DRAFT_93570 [Trametopsis cervina]|nr:hypothetical protein BDW22DRAFT_93570 [Trametopsis cervina]
MQQIAIYASTETALHLNRVQMICPIAECLWTSSRSLQQLYDHFEDSHSQLYDYLEEETSLPSRTLKRSCQPSPPLLSPLPPIMPGTQYVPNIVLPIHPCYQPKSSDSLKHQTNKWKTWGYVNYEALKEDEDMDKDDRPSGPLMLKPIAKEDLDGIAASLPIQPSLQKSKVDPMHQLLSRPAPTPAGPIFIHPPPLSIGFELLARYLETRSHSPALVASSQGSEKEGTEGLDSSYV